MSTMTGYRMESLTRYNYDTWSLQTEAALTRNKLFGYVSGECKEPELIANDDDSEAAHKAWLKNDSKAKAEIILSISPSELKQVRHCTSSRDVWTKLQSVYQSKGPARKASLLKQLTLQKLEPNGDVRAHLNSFCDAVDKLADMGVDINGDLLAIMMLYSLPNSFENFRIAIESRDELPTPEVLQIKILEESESRKQNKGESSLEEAMWAKGRQKKNYPEKPVETERPKANFLDKIRCFKCKQKGHKAVNCKIKGQSANLSTDVSCNENSTATCLFSKTLTSQPRIVTGDGVWTAVRHRT